MEGKAVGHGRLTDLPFKPETVGLQCHFAGLPLFQYQRVKGLRKCCDGGAVNPFGTERQNSQQQSQTT